MALLIVAAAPQVCQAADPGDAALTVSKEAYKAYKAADYKRAATMYRAAWHTNPATLTYLYNAARAAQLAGLLDEAERDYKTYVAKAPPQSPEVAKAWHHLGEIGESRAAARKLAAARRAPPAAKPPARTAPPPAPPARAAAGSDVRAAGWVLLVGGVGATIGGAVFLTGASSDQKTLDGRLLNKDAKGFIIGMTHKQAEEEQSRINTSLAFGYVLGGVGLLAAGTGAWLVATAPATVSLVPGPTTRSLALALRF